MKKIPIPLLFSILLVVAACRLKAPPEEAAQVPDARTPVTITTPQTGLLEEYVDLNATAVFQVKSFVKSTTNGYLQTVNTQQGAFVQRGQILFVVKTKEAESLGNSLAELDSSLHFSGLNSIRAMASGYLTQLNYQVGDYVQDGEPLATIADRNSFAFLLDLPFELRPYLAGNRTIQLLLPDGTELKGTVSNALPTVDPVAQTQSIVIRIAGKQNLPENLIATARLLKTTHRNSISLPKAAVLTNETQSAFWIMQMQGDSLAVKVPIRKGLETAERVEILSPKFQPADRIVVSGNYGLADTARVKIED
jgi:multidrug efflux pump subunit AcrA (membrane-fusion protein)